MFLDAVAPERRRKDALALDHLFREVTGFTPPVMWGGPSLVGYGAYHYVYASGREGGDFLATGFAPPRKSALSLYIMPGYQDFGGDLLDRLGKHKHGRSCLYINKLADVDLEVLAELIRAGLDGLGSYWPVRAAP